MKSRVKFKGKLKNYLNWPLYLVIVLSVMDVALLFVDQRAALAAIVFTAVYFLIEWILYLYGRSHLADEIVRYAEGYTSAQRYLLREMPQPYVLLDASGKILWMNEAFLSLSGVRPDYKKSVSAILPAVTKELLVKNETGQLHLTWGDKKFCADFCRVRIDTESETQPDLLELSKSMDYLIGLSLFDETDLLRYRQENEDQKLVAALVYIDNYDEVMNTVEDVRQSLLAALIDRRINKYFGQYDALVRRMEKDKYFVVFKYKFLKDMQENQFSLIEDVKTVKAGNEMAVTLSVGVGMWGGGYNQNYEYARAAIDLALGRGGDQAVVKIGDEVAYYGGGARQVERNTRVKARVKAQALREIMLGRENILIMGHPITDVDALGAGIGIYCLAHALGKKAQIVINNPSSSVRPLMDLFRQDQGYPADLFIDSDMAMEMVGKNTLVMVVDTNRPSYTECPGLLKKTKYVVAFDHHRQGSEVIENPILSYIEPYASSACEMVSEVVQYFQEGLRLANQEADCMYAGILIDTNNFTTKTGVRTFEAAAYLKRSGAEVTRVRKLLRTDMAGYKAKAEAIRQSETYRGVFAISTCPSEGVESPTIVCAQAANELLDIAGIKASFVMTNYQNKIYISARSIDDINVQLIMERMGGGGHLTVAGAQLSGRGLLEARIAVRDTLDQMIKEGVIRI